MELDEIRTVFFDLDSTVWYWDELIEGSKETIRHLDKAGIRIRFYTDNSYLTTEEYAKKLNDLGLNVSQDQILTVNQVAREYLEEKEKYKAYIIGSQGMIEEIEQNNIEVDNKSDTVVLGYDQKFNYSQIKEAYRTIENGGELITLSKEKTLETEKGKIPFQKPLNNTLTEFTDPIHIGKSSKIFRKKFKEKFSYFPEKALLIGDSKHDIELGNKLGMKTVATLTGELNKEKIADLENMKKPDYGITSIERLKNKFI